jgi:RAD51-like protein 1
MGTISELVGKAGAGKTQLAMQLCVVAAMNSIGTIYIDTEKKLSLERLREIANARAQSKSTVQDTENEDGAFLYHKDSGTNISHGTYKPSGQVLNNITIHSPTSTNELLAVIQNLEEEILLRNDEALQQSNGVLPVQLLVVDSIAAPTRRDFGADSAPQRVALLVQIAQVLKRLADQFNLAVVVINQVGSTMDQNYSGVRAALGTSWHHCLSTRVLMELETPAGDGKLDESFLPDAVRRATIVKSNVAGNTSMNYQISLQGLVQTTLST